MSSLKAEVARLEACCVPPRGTSFHAVSAQYGQGVRVTDPMSRKPAASGSTSRYWVFHPVTNASMLVHFDTNQKVTWAHYPHGVQNRAAPPPIEVEERETKDRIEFLKTILAELKKKGIANEVRIRRGSD